jgi:hypothetical protein
VDAEGSGKSASLIEWSRFEESAAKLNAGVEGGGSDEDKQSITSENRKLRDGDDSRDSVLACNDAKVRKEGTSTETGKVERSASVPAEVVKKVLASPSIADKLQEKLLRLQRSSKECKDAKGISSEGIPETISEEQEMEKTEKEAENSEDCETSSVSAKESDGVKIFNLETLHNKTRKTDDGESRREKDNASSGLEDEKDKRERSQSPVVNKTPLRAQPKCYGKKFLPRVVLHNLVLPSGKKILAGKIGGVTGNIISDQKIFETKVKHFMLPPESKQDQKIFPKEQHTCKIISAEDNGKTSHAETLLKSRLEFSVVHETCTSLDSESSDQNVDVANKDSSVNPGIFPCSLPSSVKPNVDESDKLHEAQNCDATDVKMQGAVNDNSSESGDGDIVMDSSKRTPEHGYSKCSFNDSFCENVANTLDSSKMQSTKASEQTEVVTEKAVELDGDRHVMSATEPAQEKGSVLEPAQEIMKELVALQSSAEELEAGSTMGSESLSKEVIASDVPPGDTAAVCGSQSKTVVISSSVSDSGNTDLNPVHNTSDSNPSTEEENADTVSGTHNAGEAASQASDMPSKETLCTEDDQEHSVLRRSSPNDNSDVSIKLSIPQTAVLKVYPAKTNKAFDKKIIDSKMSELNKTEMFPRDVTDTPTSMVSASAEEEDAADTADTTALKETDGFSIIDKKIKEEPLDPDEVVAEPSSASALTLSSCDSLAKTSLELTQQKGADGDAFNRGKIILNKKLTMSLLDDKDRSASNDSPSSLSEKDGIFPSLFLDPSITITVINDKQSESAEAPVLSRSKVGSGDINVSELRASVNLSKDISLTVVGAGYDERHSISAKGMSGPVTSLDMECDHESENESRNSSKNAASGLVPVTVQNSMIRQNSTNKQKKLRSSGSSETLQARSRARKSFPNRPVLASLKGKSHSELVNGVGSFGNKSSTQRRNSAGTNSNSSDSRRSSYATSPQEMLISTQHSGDTVTENFGGSDNNNNNPSSAVVVLPPILGNPTTNHIQALRAVNSNIGSPSHVVNSGPDMIPSRMMQVPHNQPHPMGNGTRISPAGQGSGVPTGTSRMPPQLQPRPPGPLLSQHPPSAPSEAGPMSAELNRHAHKVLIILTVMVDYN